MKFSVRGALAARGALAGIVSASVALGVAELVAAPVGPLSAPLIAVGGVVVDNVPEPIKHAGIVLFGVHDKTALLAGTAILLAGYAAALGVLALRSFRWAYAGIGLFALAGVAAAVTRHDAGAFAALPSIVGAALAVPVLRLLLARAVEASSAPNTESVAARVRSTAAAGSGAATGPASAGLKTAEPEAADVKTADVKAAGSTTAGPKTAGPKTAGPKTAGPKTAGPKAAGSKAAGSGAAGGSKRAYPGKGMDAAESRRRFLKAVAIATGVAAVTGFGGRLLTGRRAVTAARAAVTLPAPVEFAPPVPADAELHVPRLSSYVTRNADFYRIDTSLYPPQVDPATWELRIHGMVRNPITLTFAQLLARPMVERYVTLACVSNDVGGDLIGNAKWLGTAVKDLLDEAQPLDGADQVVGRSIDGWTCGSPTAVLRDGRDALLAIGMNGEPLPVEHGFPVRMVVPGLYGYVSACKWIVELELTRFADFDAYWVPRGWLSHAPIKTESRIDTPREGAGVTAGEVVVAGVAWAQHRGISRVEVQVDDGPWQVATLAGTVSSDTWRQWSWRWQATAGKHRLRVRATDSTGQTQTANPSPAEPDGATGWHQRDVTVT